MPAAPVVKAFLISDSVIQDRTTGKYSVIGIFDRIYSPNFPCMHPTVAVYIRLADAFGRYRGRIEFRDAQDQVISSYDGIELEVKERGHVVEFGFTTQMLPLQKPGKYQFQLYFNGEYAASAPLEAVQVEPPRRERP